MSRVTPALTGLAALAALAFCSTAIAADLNAKADAIHRRVIPIDAHADILFDAKTGVPDLALDGAGQADLPKIRKGGLGAVVLAAFAPSGPRTPEKIAEAKAQTDAKLKAVQDLARAHPDQVTLALTARDIERAKREGKTAVLAGFLNTYAFGDSLEPIADYYRKGVRVFGFDHAGNTYYADSSRPGAASPAEEWGGLSPLGKRAVGELNRLGVIIDVSQLTTKGFFQTLELSQAPVIATHSGVRAIVDNPRNLSDAELDAIKKNGGVVNIVAFKAYLPAPAIEAYVDVIDYAVKRIGVDHVGISTDFNHGSGFPGFNSEADAPNVTRELVRRGYSEEQIRKLWGGNFLRVFKAVEATSKKLSEGAAPHLTSLDWTRRYNPAERAAATYELG